MVQIRGKNQTKWARQNAKRCHLYYCLYYTSDWFKHQLLRNLHKAAYISIPCFLTNFLVTKYLLSLSNTEILCEEHLKLQTFLGYCFQLLWLVEIFKHKKHPLKMEFKYILFHRLHFCRFMHSLCKNENIPIAVYEESLLCNYKRNCLSSYQDHYLNILITFLSFFQMCLSFPRMISNIIICRVQRNSFQRPTLWATCN